VETAKDPPRWLVGIDIGGTFTDVAAFESLTGALRIEKLVSTPGDPRAP
jgi:N-methylhydantoinase A